MNKKFIVNGIPFTIIYVESGTFMMGTKEKWCEVNAKNTRDYQLRSR